MIRTSNIIKVGDEITAMYSTGGVEISFSAKARTEGKIGDQIQIVSKDNKIFRAKILDAGSVIITEL
jgi:flagella basal body P-ring formation protein FlgA